MDDGDRHFGLLGVGDGPAEVGNAIGHFLADQWFGVLSLLLGTALSVYFYLRQRQTKTLDFKPTVVPLLSGQQHPFEALRVTYEAVNMPSPYLVTVQIMNTGQRAVTRADYAVPITVTFEQGHAVEGAVVEESWVGVCGFETVFGDPDSPSTPTMAPTLMNQGDYFRVQFLVDEDPGEVAVNCKFADQTRPMRDPTRDYFGEEMQRALGARHR